MSLVPIGWMVKKTIEIHRGSMKRRATGKQRVAEGDDEQCLQPANFRIVKFCRLRNFIPCKIFRNLGNSQAIAEEHLQQHKTKNYEKNKLEK